jgi:hypothetical protein
MLVKIKNNLPGSLDLSPMKNHAGGPLILRGKSEYEILERDLSNPILLRVMKMGWLERVASSPAAPKPAPAPPPVVPAPVPVAAPMQPQDFLEEIEAERTAKDPEFPAVVEERYQARMGKKKKAQAIKQEASPEELKLPEVPEEKS